MNGLTSTLFLYLTVAGALGADGPLPAPLPAPSATDLAAQAVMILQPAYPDFTALAYAPGDKLDDLVARSNGSITLIAAPAIPPSPIRITAFPTGIVYCRFPSFTPKKTWDIVGGELRSAIDFWHVYGTIVDLRDNFSNDYAGAAQAMAFFASNGAVLKNYSAYPSDPKLPGEMAGHSLQGPLVVLVSSRTSGAAEVMAARLKADGAMVIGQKTAGATTFFSESPLSNGQVLRFAVAPLASTTDKAPSLPVIPDITETVDDATEKAALAQIDDDHVSDVIQGAPQRHRMNEVALVQGQDPEWDDYLASLEKKPDDHFLLSLPPIRDEALIDAIDSVEAIRVTRNSPPSASSVSAPASTSASVQ